MAADPTLLPNRGDAEMKVQHEEAAGFITPNQEGEGRGVWGSM